MSMFIKGYLEINGSVNLELGVVGDTEAIRPALFADEDFSGAASRGQHVFIEAYLAFFLELALWVFMLDWVFQEPIPGLVFQYLHGVVVEVHALVGERADLEVPPISDSDAAQVARSEGYILRVHRMRRESSGAPLRLQPHPKLGWVIFG